MGKTQSKNNAVDNKGEVGNQNVNNFILEDSVQVHNNDISILLIIITLVLGINLLLKLYQLFQKQQKKKYMSRCVCFYI